MRTFRAFLAVPVGDEIVRAAADLSVRVRSVLRDRGADAKWVPPGNMHVTLRFLGDVADAQVPAVKETLAPVVRRHASFLLHMGGLGVFPDPARPAVLWIGAVEGADALTNLAVDVGEAMTEIGFTPEDRPFHAHLTLARFRRGSSPDLSDVVSEHGSYDAGSTVVRDVLLFESTLRPRGPAYRAVWRASLNPGGSGQRQGPADR